MLCSLDEAPGELASRVPYPCVVKPLSLSGSQGVIRADDPLQFTRAVERLRAIVERQGHAPQPACSSEVDSVSETGSVESRQFLVEQFVDGP